RRVPELWWKNVQAEGQKRRGEVRALPSGVPERQPGSAEQLNGESSPSIPVRVGVAPLVEEDAPALDGLAAGLVHDPLDLDGVHRVSRVGVDLLVAAFAQAQLFAHGRDGTPRV